MCERQRGPILRFYIQTPIRKPTLHHADLGCVVWSGDNGGGKEDGREERECSKESVQMNTRNGYLKLVRRCSLMILMPHSANWNI